MDEFAVDRERFLRGFNPQERQLVPRQAEYAQILADYGASSFLFSYILRDHRESSGSIIQTDLASGGDAAAFASYLLDIEVVPVEFSPENREHEIDKTDIWEASSAPRLLYLRRHRGVIGSLATAEYEVLVQELNGTGTPDISSPRPRGSA